MNIEQELAPQCRAAACGVCARKVGLPPLRGPRGAIGAWVGYLHRHLQRHAVRAARRDLEVLGGLLAEVGTPDDHEAQLVFAQVQTLLLTPVRINAARGRVVTLSSMRDVLGLLQATPGALQKIADALIAWRSITGLDVGRFKPAQVITVMLQVPDVVAYVTHLKSRGFEHLGVVFHPNVLAQAKKATGLRGTFGGSPEYWAATKAQLNIVED